MFLLFFFFTERFNETMFSTQNLYYLSVCHVCGSYQCPYCPIFSSSPYRSLPNQIILFISIMMAIITMFYSSSLDIVIIRSKTSPL